MEEVTVDRVQNEEKEPGIERSGARAFLVEGRAGTKALRPKQP